MVTKIFGLNSWSVPGTWNGCVRPAKHLDKAWKTSSKIISPVLSSCRNTHIIQKLVSFTHLFGWMTENAKTKNNQGNILIIDKNWISKFIELLSALTIQILYLILNYVHSRMTIWVSNSLKYAHSETWHAPGHSFALVHVKDKNDQRQHPQLGHVMSRCHDMQSPMRFYANKALKYPQTWILFYCLQCYNNIKVVLPQCQWRGLDPAQWWSGTSGPRR